MRLSIMVAVTGLAVAGSAAHANTVRMSFQSTQAGRNVEVKVGSGSFFGVFAGQLRHRFSQGTGTLAGLSGDINTFCTELAQHVVGGTGAIYTDTAIASLPTPGPAMGAVRAQGVYNLFAAANGQQFGTDNDWAAAFQIALWEVVNDYSGSVGSLSLTGGAFQARLSQSQALPSGIASKVTSLFSMIGTNAAQVGLIGLGNSSHQDQIVNIVPLPPAAWAGLGVLGLAAVARRRMTRG